jgi:hypothetical protein
MAAMPVEPAGFTGMISNIRFMTFPAIVGARAAGVIAGMRRAYCLARRRREKLA